MGEELVARRAGGGEVREGVGMLVVGREGGEGVEEFDSSSSSGNRSAGRFLAQAKKKYQSINPKPKTKSKQM